MEFPKLVTGRQMTAIDRASIDDHGVPGTELMANAGGRVVETIRERWGGLEGLSIAVVCGKGNNGGDGFVIGRLLADAGVTVRVFLAAAESDFSGDAAHHMKRLQDRVEIDRVGADGLAEALRAADIVVDALLGTGLTGAPRPPLSGVIEAMNQAGRPIVAVDVPSGLDADTGAVPGACVQAAVTVTFGLAKVGHLFQPGRRRCGALELVDIGFPEAAVAACPTTTFLLTRDAVAALLPRRNPDAHKGSCGAVTVIAGAVGMTGAASLTADTALSAGAGRVTLGVPASLNDILEVKLTEVMTRPLPEVRRHRCLSLRALGEVIALLEGATAVAIGPGLGRHRDTGELVRRLLDREHLPPTVVDADGLNALVGAEPIGRGSRPAVWTPHVVEFCRLSGLSPAQVRADPLEVAADFARSRGVVLVLKGAPTVIAAVDGRTFVNPTGNPGMATAGAGDVLTGLVAGLLAQGLPPLEAALCGVFCHGWAGDRARDELGEWGMRAGDIAGQVPRSLLEVASG